MQDHALVIVLLAFVVAREIMHQISTHKLINKVMSGSYQGYLSAERTVGKRREMQPNLEQSPQEDLSYIQPV